MSAKLSTAIDKHVGSRMRMRRLILGMSQEKLGEALGITFQQIQKYEKGTNRIGASRLHAMAGVLGVPVQYFYDDYPDAGPQAAPETTTANLLKRKDSVELVLAFNRVRNPRVRRSLLQQVRAAADAEEDRAEA
jgi:transcriptional regulator with XRE-family HTH domain